MESLHYRHSGGRRPKLTPKQKQRLVALVEAGPLVVGCETACWDAVLIRVLIWREFGVLYNRQYVCTLLPIPSPIRRRCLHGSRAQVQPCGPWPDQSQSAPAFPEAM
jgi:hypothetical protein